MIDLLKLRIETEMYVRYVTESIQQMIENYFIETEQIVVYLIPIVLYLLVHMK